MGFKPRKKRRKPDWISGTTADLYDETARYVNMVRNGERNDSEIMSMVMFLTEGHNKLIEAAKELVSLQKEASRKKPLKYGDLL